MEARLVKRSAARVLNTPAMRASFEKYFPGGEITTELRHPEWFRVLGRGAAAARFRPDLHWCTPARSTRPLGCRRAERRGAAARASSGQARPRDHLRRPSGPELARIREQQLESHLEVRRVFHSLSCSSS
jgi:hypothetical protein